MKKFNWKLLKPLGITIGLLYVVIFLLFSFGKFEFINHLKLFFGISFYFFIPGFIVLLFFDMDSIERVALSVPVSISVVLLPLYLLNIIFRVLMTPLTIFIVIFIISLGGLFLFYKYGGKQKILKTKRKS